MHFLDVCLAGRHKEKTRYESQKVLREDSLFIREKHPLTRTFLKLRICF